MFIIQVLPFIPTCDVALLIKHPVPPQQNQTLAQDQQNPEELVSPVQLSSELQNLQLDNM